MRSFLAFALVMGLGAPCSAQIMLGPGDDVESQLNALAPGDEVILADGMYELTSRFSFTAIGEAARPIVIRAADGASPHFHRPDASQNIWDIEDAQHVVIRGLTLSGGSAGLRVSGATDLTIEDCEIFDTADVALRMNDGGVTYREVSILRNHIHDTGGTGEGMYLGCNDDGCRLAGAVIRGNHVHHTNAADVSQGDGIELKHGSYGCTIADNVVHDTGYPCILGYGTNGNGAPNVVERNVVWACGDHGIQWAADATIRNNIVLGAAANGIASQPHQGASPSNLTIVHNTVLAPSNDALSVRDASGEVTVANNALYAMSGRAFLVVGGASTITSAGNVGVGSQEGITGGFSAGDLATDFAAASFSGAVPNDVFPAAGGALVGAGDTAYVVDLDFDGVARMGVADVGAYAFGDGSGPAWTIAAGFKPLGPVDPPTSDAGVPMSDAGTSDGGLPMTSTPDAGTRDGGMESTSDGGCGCRAGSGGGSSSGSLALLGLALAWVVARRRSR